MLLLSKTMVLGVFKYLGLESVNVLPPKPHILPALFVIGNISLCVKRSRMVPSLAVVATPEVDISSFVKPTSRRCLMRLSLPPGLRPMPNWAAVSSFIPRSWMYDLANVPSSDMSTFLKKSIVSWLIW